MSELAQKLLRQRDRQVIARALLALAEDARIRGDISTQGDHCTDPSEWLEWWAADLTGEDSDIEEERIDRLLDHRTRRIAWSKS